jgi:hypothetical protein
MLERVLFYDMRFVFLALNTETSHPQAVLCVCALPRHITDVPTKPTEPRLFWKLNSRGNSLC